MVQSTRAWRRRVLGILLATGWALSADAVSVRLATFNVLFGVGTPGSTEYNAVKSVLQRINPDIIAFQELMDTDYENWIVLAADLGYPHLAYGPSYGPLTGSQRLGFMSRHPVTEAFELTEYPGATELTRYPLRVSIQVPGALNPLILYTVHLKASSGSVNQFRRGIEGRRILSNLVAYAEANPLTTEYVILGDFNEDVADSQTAQFSALPSGLPSAYTLGADVVFPVPYRLFPTDRFAPGGLAPLHPYQEDSTDDSTYSTGGRLDYLLFSEEIRSSPYGAPAGEIYNSTRDDGTGGLPKYGSPLAATTSGNASDHLTVFADFNLIDGLPCVNPVLFLSEVLAHPTTPGASYIELHNSGATALNITNYAVVVYFDGATPVTIPVSGTLGAGASYVLAGQTADYQTAFGRAPNLAATNLLALDGNDVVALLSPAQQISDLYGVIGEPAGPGDYSPGWTYPSQAVQRVTGYSDPNPVFTTNEWMRSVAAAASPGSHSACGNASVYYGSLHTVPNAPLTGETLRIVADIVPNAPASNLSATAYYRLNGGAFQGAAMTPDSNTTWTTAAFDPGAVAADDLHYYVLSTFAGPGAIPVPSLTNLYEYAHTVTPPVTSTATAVRFNEVDVDNPSTDDREFIELIAPAGTDLAGYRIVHHTGQTSTKTPSWSSTLPSFVVPDDGVTDSNGTHLGFCVLVTNASVVVTNADLAVMVVKSGGSLEQGPDGLLLYDPASNIIDAIAWGGAGDLTLDDPGTVVTNGDPTAGAYLHVQPLDNAAASISLQAPNDVLGDTGAGWRTRSLTPGALNIGQTSGVIRIAATPVVIADTDGDGLPDNADNCPETFNPTQTDLDNDGLGDACDPDRDGDGVPDTNDNCAATANPGQADLDGDLQGDACDPDLDGDGVFNDDDNCPETANGDQADLDGDGVGDVCDPDDDNDGVADLTDTCPLLANPGQADLDGDLIGDECDPDLDGDGVTNEVDNCPTTPNPTQADADQNGVGDACDIDTDGDGVSDLADNCLGFYNPAQIDGDADGLGDGCDACTGQPVQTNLLNTGFPTGLPSGWTIVSTGLATAVWRFDDPVFRGNRTGATGLFAIAESSLYSRNSRMDTQLRSPPLDLRNVTTAEVSFSTYFDYRTTRSNEVADVDLSITGTNGPWLNLWRRTNDTSGRFTLDLTPYAGASNAVLRFHYYNAYQENFWQVDDVVLSCARCVPPPDGDGDGVGDAGDNCPGSFNPDQSDLDRDGAGDPCDADRDGDGLPDAWEEAYFGNPTGATASADSDGDGWANRDEFAADTQPTNQASFFPALTNANGGRVMTLILNPTSTGRLYDVLWSTNLDGGTASWQSFDLVRTGTGNAVTFSVTNDQPLIFLRTRVRLP